MIWALGVDRVWGFRVESLGVEGAREAMASRSEGGGLEFATEIAAEAVRV